MGSFPLRWLVAVVIVLFLVSGLAGGRSALADYYRYTDRNGTICLTNDLKSIPEQYRSKAVLVGKDAPKSEQPRPAASQPPAGQADEEVGQPPAPTGFKARMAAFFTSGRVVTGLKIVGVLVLVVAAYAGIGMLAAYLGCRQIGTLIRIVFTLAVLAYGFVTYADKMAATLSQVKKEVTVIQQKSEVRNSQTGEPGVGKEPTDEQKALGGQAR